MIKKLRLGYFADGIWGHNAFKLINSDKEFEIKFVVPRFNTFDPVLEQMAMDCKIDYFKSQDVNSNEFLAKISEYECHLLVSMSFDQIFKPAILSRYKIINCHAGKLPFYRGRNILNWALINDEKEFGITTHYVDDGIDTGDIVFQKVYPISDDDNYCTLLSKAYEECPKVLYAALKKIKSGDNTTIRQSSINEIGMYCGKRQEGDELINWNSSSRELFNFIRAICSPGPVAKTYLNHRLMSINASKMINRAPNYIGIPGQILYKNTDFIVVKTKDSVLKVTEYDYAGSVKIGDRLRDA